MTKKLENFLALVSDKTSGWLEKAQCEIQNEDWLDFSAEIAIKVLRTLRAKGISQKDLAELMNVSPQYINKIVKGSENLSIETIFKLQNALDITLIQISNADEIEIEVCLTNNVVMHPSVNTFQNTIEYSDELYVPAEIDLPKEVA